MTTNVSGTHFLLAALKELQPECKFYFAGSSEMFGRVREAPQNEETRFHPRSAYGISKVTGFDLTRNYREEYGMFCCTGILFNHESPRRSFEFVTRKITSGVARIKLGMQKELRLGNLDAERDWGHAKDYVCAMHRMLLQEKPDDFVVATGKSHTVREFCDLAFKHVGLNYRRLTSSWIQNFTDPRKNISCWAIQPKQKRSSIGSRSIDSRIWLLKWWMQTSPIWQSEPCSHGC